MRSFSVEGDRMGMLVRELSMVPPIYLPCNNSGIGEIDGTCIH